MNNKLTYGVIGDLHGRDVWKTFVTDKTVDKWVFIGDYVDDWTIDNITMKCNLLDIIQFKKDNMDKVILLLGNHDIQYIHSPKYRCSGFRPEMLFDFQEIFQKNRKLFQVAYQINNYLFTHAGLHKGYYEYRIKPNIEDEDINLADTLNRMYEFNKNELFDIGFRRGGNKNVGGIFWADKIETSNKSLPEYHQIIGHTQISDIITIKKDNNTSITFCDCLQTINQFYKIII